MMWCIGKLTMEYRHRMYGLLKLYAKPLNPLEPVVCVDEKSKQLLIQTRKTIQGKAGASEKEDYEYRRAGTRNIFVAVEPLGKFRKLSVTARRTKVDFVTFIQDLATTTYASAKKIHLVMDNLNTHFQKSFIDVLGTKDARRLLRRLKFHYTPKHASWLNMAEIEIAIMDRQCTGCRFANEAALKTQVSAWESARNLEGRGIQWKFTRQEADKKLSRHYVS